MEGFESNTFIGVDSSDLLTGQGMSSVLRELIIELLNDAEDEMMDAVLSSADLEEERNRIFRIRSAATVAVEAIKIAFIESNSQQSDRYAVCLN